MIRKGAIISVRIRPFPKTSEFSSEATARPRTTEIAITEIVRTTVLNTAVLRLSSVTSLV